MVRPVSLSLPSEPPVFRSGLRARSAFKLMQIDDKFDLLRNVTRAVDLCAAPGGWSEVLSARMKGQQEGTIASGEDRNAGMPVPLPTAAESSGSSSPLSPSADSAAAAEPDEVKVPIPSAAEATTDAETKEAREGKTARIVAVDLQTMLPLPGVHIIKGDITRHATAEEVLRCFGGQKAEIVVCDGAPDVIGLHDADEFVQHTLVIAAFELAAKLLCEGGAFVAKIFRGKHIDLLYQRLQTRFRKVSCAKPKASRNSSIESFVVCQDFSVAPLSDCTRPLRPVPFVACGSDCPLDSDKSYPLTFQIPVRSLLARGEGSASTAAAGVEEKEEGEAAAAVGTGLGRGGGYVALEPRAAPVDPPYKKYLERRRQEQRQQKAGS